MMASEISKNYAQALIDVSFGNYSEMKSQLHAVEETVKSSKDLCFVMENPSISVDKKLSIIDSLFIGKVSDKIINLLKLMIEKGRFNEFSNVCSSFFEKVDALENKKRVEIVSAIDLDEKFKSRIILIIETKLNCTVVPKWTVDEGIIAGLVFKYDDYIVDTSAKTRLESMCRNILR